MKFIRGNRAEHSAPTLTPSLTSPATLRTAFPGGQQRTAGTVGARNRRQQPALDTVVVGNRRPYPDTVAVRNPRPYPDAVIVGDRLPRRSVVGVGAGVPAR